MSVLSKFGQYLEIGIIVVLALAAIGGIVRFIILANVF
jgi:hypothetical protein